MADIQASIIQNNIEVTIDWIAAPTISNAASVTTDTTNFDNILSNADDEVQKALETIDEYPSAVSTLSNKTFEDEVRLEVIDTPATPAPGTVKIYAKSDNKVYQLDEYGVEKAIGGGAGTGDVLGPATNTDGYIPQWDGVNTKTLKNGLAVPAGGLAGLTALGAKLDANTPITGATKTKVTYDADGLVTAGADATTADIADSLNKRYVTDANLTTIGNQSGTNTGDETQSTIKTKLGAATASSDGYATSTQITKLDGIAAGAEVNVNADWNASSGDAQILNKPSIPDSLSDLSEDSTHRTVTDTEKSTWNGKQDALGFTPENVANKSTNVTTDGSSDTKYPSVKAIKDYADGLVVGLLDYRGGYDASVNTWPASGGSGTAGAVLKGDMWVISVAGTLGGNAVQVGDAIAANTDTPGQTAGNWNSFNANISYVPEDAANKVTSISGASTDTQYPSAKLVYDQLAGKQPTGNYATGGGTATGTNTGDNATNSQYSGLATSKADRLIAVATKASNYTANANEFVPADVSGGSFAVTLPTAPADGTRVQVEVVVKGTTGVCEVKVGGGSDVIARPSGPTSVYMSLQEESVILQYQASTAVWWATRTATPSNFAINFPGVDASTPITNANISVSAVARTITVTPPLGYFNVFIDGGGKATRFRKTTVVFGDGSGTSGNNTWTDTSGSWYFYLNSSGQPVSTQTPWSVDDFPTVIPIYRCLWNATLSGANKLVAQYVEYHVNDISADDHAWFHLYGAIWSNGFTMINNALASGNPNIDGRNTVIALTTGSNRDDNLEYSVTNSTAGTAWTQDLGNTTAASLNATNSAQFKIFTQDAGGLVSFLPATRFPFDWNSGTNVPQYITATGTRTAVTNQRFMVTFVYATQNPVAGEALKVVCATQDFTTLANARAYTWTDIQNAYSVLGNDGEIRPLYRLIFEVHTASPNVYTSAEKFSVLRETQDIRKAAVTSTTASTGSLPASSVTVVPAGTISSTNAQAALEELDSEKVPTTRSLTINGVAYDLSADRTWTISSGISWSEVTGTSQSMAVDTGYIANNGSLVTLTLPSTAAIGKVVRVSGKGAGLFKIAQGANQYIRFNSTTSTTGTGGYITANEQYCSIELVCSTADNGWTVTSSSGNFTVT